MHSPEPSDNCDLRGREGERRVVRGTSLAPRGFNGTKLTGFSVVKPACAQAKQIAKKKAYKKGEKNKDDVDGPVGPDGTIDVNGDDTEGKMSAQNKEAARVMAQRQNSADAKENKKRKIDSAARAANPVGRDAKRKRAASGVGAGTGSAADGADVLAAGAASSNAALAPPPVPAARAAAAAAAAPAAAAVAAADGAAGDNDDDDFES